MILQQHKREFAWNKAKRLHYPTAKRIREYEQMFEMATKADDIHNATYFDRQIEKLYASIGLKEG